MSYPNVTCLPAVLHCPCQSAASLAAPLLPAAAVFTFNLLLMDHCCHRGRGGYSSPSRKHVCDLCTFCSIYCETQHFETSRRYRRQRREGWGRCHTISWLVQSTVYIKDGPMGHPPWIVHFEEKKKKGGLRDFIGLAQCPSRKSTNGPLRSIKMIYNILFWLNYDSPAQKCASAHRAFTGTPDGQSMPAWNTSLSRLPPFSWLLSTLFVDFGMCFKKT